MTRAERLRLAEVVLAVDDYQKATDGKELKVAKVALGNLVKEFGVTLMEGRENDVGLAASVALFLFGDSDRPLPGGYSSSELDDMSPIKLVASFPQELVLLGRATVLLKGIAKKLDVPFSLAENWGAGCLLTLSAASEPSLPAWGKEVVASADASPPGIGEGKIRFRSVARLLRQWGRAKTSRFVERVVKKLPPAWRKRAIEAELKRLERRTLS